MPFNNNGNAYSIQVAPIEMEFISVYFNSVGGTNTIANFMIAANAVVSDTSAISIAIATAKAGLTSNLISLTSSASNLLNSTATSSSAVTSAINAAKTPASLSGVTTKGVQITDLANGLGAFAAMTNNTQNKYAAYFSAAQKVAAFNKQNFGGHNDWYIPSYYELNAIYCQAKPEATDSSDLFMRRNPIDDTSYTSPSLLGANGKPLPYKRNGGLINGAEPPDPSQTTKRSFKRQDGIVGINSFNPEVNYMSSTLHMSKASFYTISFNDGGYVLRAINDNVYVRPIRRST